MNKSQLFLLLPFFTLSCSTVSTQREIANTKDCTGLMQDIFFSKKVSEQALINAYEKVGVRKSTTSYPNIPTHQQISIVEDKPFEVVKPVELSAGLRSPELEEARELGGVFDDYKMLSDAKPKNLSEEEIVELKRSSKAKSSNRREYLKNYIEGRYTFEADLRPSQKPLKKEKIAIPSYDTEGLNEFHREAYSYVQNYWENLVRVTPTQTKGSILPLPYEFVVANPTRFDEMYYWDTYFGMKGLLSSGHLDLSQKIVENFLYMIREYGVIPNGNRDYYLSRSQPPFISSMVKEVFEESMTAQPARKAHLRKWLKERAFPLLQKDLEDFWMNPKTRYDESTGLHHHYDDINLARPERHSADKELADDWNDEHGLGITYQDTRAVAESGLDFTDGLGKEASHTANTLLNAMVYKYMKDLEYFARELDLDDEAMKYAQMAEKKKAAMDRYLWSSKGHYQNYIIGDDKQIDGLHAEVFTAMYAKAASPEQAKELVSQLRLLEKEGGVMSSLYTDSHHQWDGDNGWAPLHYFVIQGLRNYGYDEDADRIAKKIANSYAKIHHKEGVFLERIDVSDGSRPIEDGKKYPVQEGFLWTNGVYTWILNSF